jgi:hypothetical protein
VTHRLRAAPTKGKCNATCKVQEDDQDDRFNTESFVGCSLSLVTEVNERAVVLTCFGELAPFDEIAVTLGAHAL